MSLLKWLLFGVLAMPLASASDVALLRSDDISAYRETAEAVVSAMNVPVAVYDLEGDRETAYRVVARLKRRPPKVVIALGKKAAYAARRKLDGIPILVAQVDNLERYGLNGPLLSGVTQDVSMDEVLSYLRLFAPDVERIGMLMWQGNQDARAVEAIEAGRDAGYKVRALRVGSQEDVPGAFMRLRREIDAFWLVPDHLVVTPENFRFLRDESRRLDMPLIAYTESLVRAGALMAVGPDREAIGQQIAELAQAILAGRDVSEMPFQPPRATRVVLNRAAQEEIGLAIDDAMLGFVDEVLQGSGP